MEEKRRHEASLPLGARCAALRPRKSPIRAPPRHDRFARRCQPAATNFERWRSPPIAAFIWPPSLHSDPSPKPWTRKLAAIRGGAAPPEHDTGDIRDGFANSMPSGLSRRDHAQAKRNGDLTKTIALWPVL